MKSLRYFKLFLIVILISITNQVCFAEDTSQAEKPSKSYSELLGEAVGKAGMFKSGYELISARGMRDGLPRLTYYVEELDEKEAVPFLLEVIQNGPDWPIDKSRGRDILAIHIARCYAVLCLASTKDAQAYPVLTNLLQNGTYLVDSNMGGKIKQKYDIQKYAAFGLGILGDDRAFDLLVTALDDANPHVKYQSMFALAKIKDTRAIESILNAATNYELDDFALNVCMEKLTKAKFESKYSRERKELSFPDFPELGAVKSPRYRQFWQHWYKKGKKWTEKQFASKHNKWKEVKAKHPKEHDSVKYAKRKFIQLGVAALPLLIEKIKAGETELIDIVSELTDGKIKKDATKQEVLSWWEKNKEKWTIFPAKQQDNKERPRSE